MKAARWKQLRDLFEAAREQPVSRRPGFLQQACPDNADLRHEVEALLNAEVAADDRSFLNSALASATHETLLALKPGDTLGHFQILASVGRGGMGEVYRARDTRLKREVALKVLPDSLARDPERMLRFQREAEVLASLNHPNIAQIHGVEDRALIMEFVDGQTLPTRLPIETALGYATQIAAALEYAHDRGIIHRDLKPANVKLTSEGTVKLLDFGLAKAVEVPSAPRSGQDQTIGVTREDLILGTATYMSPEQANGKAADRRADIWSFGAVLYEMLAGKRAFEGESDSDTIARVLKLEPDLSALPSRTPPTISRLIERCLTKDRRQRLQAIGEARIAIDYALSGSPQAPALAPASRSIIPWAIAGTLATGLVISLSVLWRASQPPDPPLIRLDVDLGPEISLPLVGEGSPSSPWSIFSRQAPTNSVIISPDGARLVYVASVSGGPPKLFTRRLDQPNAVELAGTEGVIFPFFSPDGREVGFTTDNKLSKIPVEGGAVVPLADVLTSAASWGEGGDIVLDHLPGRGLLRLPSGGGPATPVTVLAAGEFAHADPQFLPGGKDFLFTVYRDSTVDVDKASIEVMSLSAGRRKTLVQGGTSPRYVASSPGSGHLVFCHKGSLFAVSFDLSRLETRGSPVQIFDGIAYETTGGMGQFDISRGGTLVYRRPRPGPTEMSTVQWINAAGRMEPLVAKPGAYWGPSLSWDGKLLAIEIGDGSGRDIWLYDQGRDTMTRLTFGGAYRTPLWSPNGRYLVFASLAGGIFWTRTDGAGQPQSLLPIGKFLSAWSFTPDGKWLAFTELDPVSSVPNSQVWTVAIEGNGDQLHAEKPERSCGLGSPTVVRYSHPTVIGWPTNPMNPARRKYTCVPSSLWNLGSTASGRSPTAAPEVPPGRKRANSFTCPASGLWL